MHFIHPLIPLETPQQPQQSFRSLGIAPALLSVLEKKQFTIPTPIQLQSIPAGLEGKDIVGIAQTGTGKTFAFGIPMLQRIAQGAGRGLIVVPTRELAHQVEESLQIFAPALGIRTVVLVGGESMGRQKAMIRRNPQIVVATPGRLNDLLDQKAITLREVAVLVLDEADRMFDMGFRPQLNLILNQVPKERQTMLFSATMPTEIMQLAKEHMKLPLRIEVAPAGTTARDIEQELFIVQKHEKLSLLDMLLKEHTGSILVFSRTKHGAKKITRAVRDMGHTAAEIHANRTQGQRRQALEGFRNGSYRILIATDIAARGIDVTGIEVVINFDLPDDPGDYVHRIGRTARAGRAGKAISFALAEQNRCIRDIERLIRLTLPRAVRPGFAPSARPAPSQHSQSQHPAQRRRDEGNNRSFPRNGPSKFRPRRNHSGRNRP